MKKILSLIVILSTLMSALSLSSCSDKKEDSGAEISSSEASTETLSSAEESTSTEESSTVSEPVSEAPVKTLETKNAKVDGFYVDTSYIDDDNSALKMVYLFLTLKADEKNLSVTTTNINMKIGENKYESKFYKNSCKFMPSYYYSSYYQDVYVGTELKLALTFKVPEGDLTPDKVVTLSHQSVPVKDLYFSTSDLVECSSPEEIGAAVDPDGCAKEVNAREAADDSTVKKVRKSINGYTWTFYVSAGATVQEYNLSFSSTNKFTVHNAYLSITNSGTYEVRNGYLFLYFKNDTEPTTEIRYEYIDGKIKLYCSEAYSIYE